MPRSLDRDAPTDVTLEIALALLALPLCVPTLIFGAGAIETLAAGDGIVTHVAILAALALVALATTPWAIAAALRQAGE